MGESLGADNLGSEASWRGDAADDSRLAVMIPIPTRIQEQFPCDLKDQPHVTMVFVGPATLAQRDAIADIVRKEAAGLAGSVIRLGPLGHFNNADRVAYASVLVPDAVAEVRNRIAQRISAIMQVPRVDDWVPHATLAYLPPNTAYIGPVPEGEWELDQIQIWHAGDRVLVTLIDTEPSTSRADTLKRSGDKWEVWTGDGSKKLGEYDTEDEARERLRQIEAAKAARADLAVPDEATVKAWLVEHISDVRKMSRPRMEALKALEGKYPYLRPPPVSQVFRGLRNIEPRKIDTWQNASDPVIDKSWSTTEEAAAHFARAEWTLEAPEPGRVGALITARAASDRLLLNPSLLAKTPGVGDVIHPIWNEPLSKAILDEQEVLALGSLPIVSVVAVEMTGRRMDWMKAARTDARSEEEKAEIRSRWSSGEGPNMGPAGHREWLDTPFSGPNRKTGEDRERARRIAERAQRVMSKSTSEWTDEDYTGAVEIMAYIARASEQDQGDPIVIDGREGPSPNRAALMDWGYDPKIAKRGDAVQWELPLFAPAVHTPSRNLIENVYRFDKAEYLVDPGVELDIDPGPAPLANGWCRYPVLYSRVGCQRYVINGREVVEYRSPDEVFSEASMRSGWGVPWELRHSDDLLTPQTVLGVACGTTLTVAPYKDGIHTCGYAHAWDEELRRSIDNKTAGDVSVAFRCKVDPRPGHDDYGQRFDRRQVEIVWNSLASEPRGRAGSARVLSSRADATDGMIVDSASAMLALARTQRPSRPVYYDPKCFRRLDAHDVAAPPSQTPKKDADMKLLPLLMQATGLDNAAVAEALGVSEADLMTMIEDPTQMSDEQMIRLVEMLVPRGEMPENEVEDMSDDVKKSLEERVAMLERAVSDANKRADAAEIEIKSRDEKIAGMVTEAEAVKRADAARSEGEARALHAGTAITLAQRALGFDWHPGMVRGEDGSWSEGEERKDADGNPIPVTIKDWERGAILGAFGDDEGAKVLADVDAAPDSAYDYVMGLRLKDAAKRLDARDLQCDDLRSAVARTTANAVNDKKRQDAEEKDRIQALIEQQQKTASAVVRTQGAA